MTGVQTCALPIFNQFGPGIEAFSAPADVSRIEISGNVVFNSGLAGVLSQPNVVVGTHQSEATGIIVQDNIFWQRSGMAAAFGSKSAEGEITVSGNYFRGLVRFRQWRKASVMRNTFAATGTLIVLHLPGVKPDGYAWNRNSYFWQESDFEPFAHYADNAGGGLNWFQWKHTTSFDSAGTFVKGGLKKPYVQTRSMSRDGAGRWYYAAVVASDGSEAAVEVDLSAVLPDGARFRVYHVEDVERLRPVLEETWSGKAVALPMRAVPGPESLAGLLLSLPASGPEFQVFIIERLSGDAEVEPALSASN